MAKEAIVLLSGGLDSTTALAIAKDEGFECRTLTFDYGQRHRFELRAAKAVAQRLGSIEHIVFKMDFRVVGGSALTANIEVPRDRDESEMTEIPVTYVPARNSVFLSIAAGLAEARGARDIFLGVNAVDYSGYPDCRPEYVAAMEEAIAQGTKCGVEGDRIRIRAPLIQMTKADTVPRGIELGVDYGLPHSCYDPSPEGLACGHCDSCALRGNAFMSAGIEDPTRYVPAQIAQRLEREPELVIPYKRPEN